MRRSYSLMALLLLPAALIAAEQGGGAGGVEVLPGMSIMGDNEAPTALSLIAWKSSEIGSETRLSSNLLSADMTPVDKAVFMRELDFYNVSNPQ